MSRRRECKEVLKNSSTDHGNDEGRRPADGVVDQRSEIATALKDMLFGTHRD